MNVVKNQEYEKAKQANAFLLAPLQEYIPSFVLAISPVYNGKDYALVRHWFNQVALWGLGNDITVAGLERMGILKSGSIMLIASKKKRRGQKRCDQFKL